MNSFGPVLSLVISANLLGASPGNAQELGQLFSFDGTSTIDEPAVVRVVISPGSAAESFNGRTLEVELGDALQSSNILVKDEVLSAVKGGVLDAFRLIATVIRPEDGKPLEVTPNAVDGAIVQVSDGATGTLDLPVTNYWLTVENDQIFIDLIAPTMTLCMMQGSGAPEFCAAMAEHRSESPEDGAPQVVSAPVPVPLSEDMGAGDEAAAGEDVPETVESVPDEAGVALAPVDEASPESVPEPDQSAAAYSWTVRELVVEVAAQNRFGDPERWYSDLEPCAVHMRVHAGAREPEWLRLDQTRSGYVFTEYDMDTLEAQAREIRHMLDPAANTSIEPPSVTLDLAIDRNPESARDCSFDGLRLAVSGPELDAQDLSRSIYRVTLPPVAAELGVFLALPGLTKLGEDERHMRDQLALNATMRFAEFAYGIIAEVTQEGRFGTASAEMIVRGERPMPQTKPIADFLDTGTDPAGQLPSLTQGAISQIRETVGAMKGILGTRDVSQAIADGRQAPDVAVIDGPAPLSADPNFVVSIEVAEEAKDACRGAARFEDLVAPEPGQRATRVLRIVGVAEYSADFAQDVTTATGRDLVWSCVSAEGDAGDGTSQIETFVVSLADAEYRRAWSELQSGLRFEVGSMLK